MQQSIVFVKGLTEENLKKIREKLIETRVQADFSIEKQQVIVKGGNDLAGVLKKIMASEGCTIV